MSESSSTSNGITSTSQLDPFKLRSVLDSSHLPGRPTCVCLSADNQYIFIGGDGGQINTYTFDNKTNKPQTTTNTTTTAQERPLLLLTSKRISKKAISQLHLLQPLDPSTALPSPLASSFLFLLSDGRLLACHPLTLAIVMDFASTVSSSASLFTIDPLMPHQVAVGYKNKKKLTLHSITYDNTGGSGNGRIGNHTLVRELPIPDIPTALSYCGDWLCFSTRRSYYLIHTASAQLRELPVPLSPDSSPSIHVLSASELLLTASNDLALFVDAKGDPLPTQPIDWKRGVIASVQCDQYIVGVLNGDVVKVASLLEGGRIVQTVAVSKPVAAAATPTLALANNTTSRISSSTINYDESNKLIAVITPTSLLLLHLTSLSDQIQQYMNLSMTDQALQLLLRTKPSAAQLAHFHTQAGFVLLCDGLQLAAAFQHFAVSSVDPRELLVLFKDLAVKSITYNPIQHSILHSQLGVSFSTSLDILSLIERGRKQAMSADNKKHKSIVGLSVRQLARQCRLQLAIFLWNKRHSIQRSKDVEMIEWVDTALLMLVVEFREGSGTGQVNGGGGGENREETALPSTTFPMNSRSSSPTRSSLTTLLPSSSSLPSTSASSPTTPFHASTVSSSAAASTLFPFTLRQLLFPGNACLLADCEGYLLGKRYYAALALLYQSKGSVRQALHVWMKMSSGEYKPAIAVTNDTAGAGQTSTNVSSAAAAAAAAAATAAVNDGISESVKLLSTLSDQPLLWEFSEWILLKKPSIGLKIFTAPTRIKGSSEVLSAEKVLRFLKATGKKSDPFMFALRGDGDAEGSPVGGGGRGGGGGGIVQPIDLVESYLEFLVSSEPTCDSHYHTQLALTYLDRVLLYSSLPSRTSIISPSPSPDPSTDLAAIRAALQQQRLSGKGVKRGKLGSEPGHFGAARVKFFQFVQGSEGVDAQIVLQKLLATTWPHLASSSSFSLSSSSSSSPSSPSSLSFPSSPPSHLSLPSGLTLSSYLIDSFRPFSHPYEELILLYSKLRLHTAVLSLYIYGLRDEAGAAAYCRDAARREERETARRGREERERAKEKEAKAAAAAEAGGEEGEMGAMNRRTTFDGAGTGRGSHESNAGGQASSADQSPHPGDVFLHLLDIYLSDEYQQLFGTYTETSNNNSHNDSEYNYSQALSLLSTYAAYLPPSKLILRLPPSLPLSSLSSFFPLLFPLTVHRRRHFQLVKSLTRIQHLRMESGVHGMRRNMFVIEQGKRCMWCKKVIGEAVFVAYPIQKGHVDWEEASQKSHLERERDMHLHSNNLDVGVSSGSVGLLDGSSSLENVSDLVAYMIVHYQCSSAYQADANRRMQAGVEARLKSPNANGS